MTKDRCFGMSMWILESSPIRDGMRLVVPIPNHPAARIEFAKRRRKGSNYEGDDLDPVPNGTVLSENSLKSLEIGLARNPVIRLVRV
jgi:hypothetical protein